MNALCFFSLLTAVNATILRGLSSNEYVVTTVKDQLAGEGVNFRHIAFDANGEDVIFSVPAERVVKRWVASTGEVEIVAGIVNTLGDADGPVETATFQHPWGLAVDTATGDIYVGEYIVGNHRIRKLEKGNNYYVSTYAHFTLGKKCSNSEGPYGLAYHPNGDLYVTCGWALYKITGVEQMEVAFGDAYQTSNTLTDPLTKFSQLVTGVDFDETYENLYIAGRTYIGKFNIADQTLTVVTGKVSWYGNSGTEDGGRWNDGEASVAGLNIVYDVYVSKSGNVYFVDYNIDRVRKYTAATNMVTTVMGHGSGNHQLTSGRVDVVDGPTGVGTVHRPFSIINKPSTGELFIADNGQSALRKVSRPTIASCEIITTWD